MKLKRRNKAHPEFSLAAMTDVILLLLIFFMITSAASNQSAIDVKLPKTEAELANIPSPLSVSIKEDGRYYVDDLPIEKGALENYIVSKLKDTAKPSFVIRADRNTLHKDFVFVMEIAEKNKYDIAIATTQQD